MMKVVCPHCGKERKDYELVEISVEKRKYNVRCPDCGKTFVAYGGDSTHQEGPTSPE